MKLRSMSATISTNETITLKLRNGEVITLENATVLTSYASRVAVYSKKQVFLLPRYGASVTTWKHLHAFIDDFCEGVRDYSSGKMRYNAEHEMNGGEYQFADGIVTKRLAYHNDTDTYVHYDYVDRY